MYGTVTSIVTTTGNHNTITTLTTHKNLPSSHLTFNISFFGCSITTATLLPPIVCAVPITYLPKLNTRCEKIANLWEVAVTYRLVGGGCGEWWWYTGDGNGNRDAHDKEIQFMMMTSRVVVWGVMVLGVGDNRWCNTTYQCLKRPGRPRASADIRASRTGLTIPKPARAQLVFENPQAL